MNTVIKKMKWHFIWAFVVVGAVQTASAFPMPIDSGCSIEIRGLRLTKRMLYIGRDTFLAYPPAFFDSAVISQSGIAKIHFTPDSKASYEIRADMELLKGDLGLAHGDSIVYVFDSAHSDLRLVYDRIGANVYQEGLDDDSKFLGYETKASDFPDTSCTAFTGYRNSVIKCLNYSRKEADTFASRFPEHKYLIWRNYQEVNDYYNLAIAYYFREYECDPKTHGCLNFDFYWIDTVRFGSKYPPDIRTFVQYALVTHTLRWFATRNEKPSLHDLKHYDDQAAMVLQWSGLLRDIALYQVAFTLDYAAGRYIPPSYGIRFLKQIVDTLEALHGDPRITKLIQARLETLESHRVGTVAENFTLPDTGGILHSLYDYKGKAILLHFWATSCGPCIREIPAITAFEKSRQEDTNLHCINIACEEIPFDQWNTFIHSSGLIGTELYYHIIPQKISATRPFGFQWVQWTPTYIVLDRHGRLISADDNPPPNKQLGGDILKAESDE